MIAKDGKPLYWRALGLANADARAPITTETVFRIGSLTKQFTAAAILKLHEQGKLDPSDLACQFIPKCPAEWRSVTIHHLLTHTSGIPDLFGQLGAVPIEDTHNEIDHVLAAGTGLQLESPPGEKYSYSNFGYCLLGYIIEIKSGKPWAQFLHEQIFEPLGMQATRYDDVWTIVPGRAEGYEIRNGALRKIPYKDHAAYSAGGLLSTAGDFLRWDRALYDSRLLSAQSRELLFQLYKENYAYGWQVKTAWGKKVITHNGEIDGFSSDVQRYPESKTLILVLGNIQNLGARMIGCDLAAILFASPDATIADKPIVKVSNEKLQSLAGNYSGSPQASSVEVEADALRIHRGGLNSRLLPISERDFVLEASPDVLVRFETASTQPAMLTAIRCGGELFRASRIAKGP